MLAENSGATQRAVEYLQTSFDVSTRANQAYIAGAAGETTVALFYSEQQFELAEKWLEKAQPWVDQSGNPGLIFSFAMRREEVRIARGELATAADNLRRLAQSAQPNIEVQMVGLVYLALSSAEQQQQHFDAAHDAAREAIARLQSFPRSLYLAEHMRLEAMFEKGEYSQDHRGNGPTA